MLLYVFYGLNVLFAAVAGVFMVARFSFLTQRVKITVLILSGVILIGVCIGSVIVSGWIHVIGQFFVYFASLFLFSFAYRKLREDEDPKE